MQTSEILQNLGIEALNPMQQAALRAFSEPKDLVLLAPTGSGKTLAFLLPLVQFLRPDIDGVQALVLVPSRELAMQIESVFKAMNTSLRAMSCYGGRPAMDEHRTMRGIQPSLLIGTPGRINDHLRKHNFKTAALLTLVIDEFDKCLELGFQAQMSELISALPRIEKRILLSATDAPEIPHFVGVGADGAGISSRYRRLSFIQEDVVCPRLSLYRVDSPDKDKLETLYKLLCTLGNQSTLVFCNYRESVERVRDYLQSRNMPCDMYHGGMLQPDRERALYKFRNGSTHVLISTDLAARGLDIPLVEHIVHYHLPATEESFTHRNGRTARQSARGSSYLILYDGEPQPDFLPDALAPFVLANPPAKPQPSLWATLYIGKGKKDKLGRGDIVGFLCKKGQLTAADIGAVEVKEHYAYATVSRRKLRHLLGLIQTEKIKGMKTLFEEAN
ncbi:MAG: DEAD/DEAH box helicase [Prevotellaceae bacterium]|jgi:superfamily II DNA/RNA helicase|nr:DEAD/DEAH box helicase [Prevotellaceae bacterium]